MDATTSSPTSHAIRRLAAADPDFDAFAAEHAELAARQLSANDERELARVLEGLVPQLPETSKAVQRMSAGQPGSFDAGLASVPLLLAAAFILRTRLRVERDEKGKWQFLVEHKPADSKLVGQLLEKIAGWLHDNAVSRPDFWQKNEPTPDADANSLNGQG